MGVHLVPDLEEAMAKLMECLMDTQYLKKEPMKQRVLMIYSDSSREIY